MFAGMEIFRALATSHPLYLGQADPRNVTLETFPQAVACALAGQIVSAKEKNRGRRGLLTRAGIDESKLGNIDEVDAALCALAAQSFSQRSFHAYGDREGGYIVVPAWSRRARAASNRAVTAPDSRDAVPRFGENYRRPSRRFLPSSAWPFVPIAGQRLGILGSLGVAWAASAHSRLRPRMRLRVNFLEPRHAHVGVNLRRR